MAERIAMESKELFDNNEILGEDFHKILLGIQNLIEYFNRKYFKDDNIEEEMVNMTKTLYDPLVEKKGIEHGKAELLIKILNKKFKQIPSCYEEKIKMLSEEKLDNIGLELFDMNNIDELEKYL